MALDKAIKYGKEKRRPYKDCLPKSCRNHGSCPFCYGNRKHKFRDKHPEIEEELEEIPWYFESGLNELSEKQELYFPVKKSLLERLKNFFNRKKKKVSKHETVCCISCKKFKPNIPCKRNAKHVDGKEVAMYWCDDYESR